MDIEHYEYVWTSILSEIHLKKLKQIVIEFHGLDNLDENKIKCFEKLNNTHYLIHAHRNNHEYVINNYIPNVIELTFINKNEFSFIPPLNTMPLPFPELDFPNAIDKIDIDLNIAPFVFKNNSYSSIINKGIIHHLGELNETHLIIQSDGNLVFYNEYRHPIWSSNSIKDLGYYQLRMQQDGNLVIYNYENKPIWASNTCNIGINPYELILDKQNKKCYIQDANKNITFSIP
jgi:hypothetical protein